MLRRIGFCILIILITISVTSCQGDFPVGTRLTVKQAEKLVKPHIKSLGGRLASIEEIEAEDLWNYCQAQLFAYGTHEYLFSKFWHGSVMVRGSDIYDVPFSNDYVILDIDQDQAAELIFLGSGYYLPDSEERIDGPVNLFELDEKGDLHEISLSDDEQQRIRTVIQSTLPIEEP